MLGGVVKFSMEEQTLARLGERSATESDDLGALVLRLGDAAEPLAGQFNGPAKASFDSFKGRTDEIAAALNGALVGIVGSIAGQQVAFVRAAEDVAAAHDAVQGQADFGDQVFLSRIVPR